MTQKEAVAIILDLTPDLLNNDKENLKVMMQMTNQLIVQKLLYYSKSHEVSVMLLKPNTERQANDMQIFIPFGPSKLDLIRSIKQLYDDIADGQHDMLKGGYTGDVFKSIDQTIDLFYENYGQKKVTKKIFMITSGNSQTEYTDDRIIELKGFINTQKILINVIALDFWKADREPFLSPTQKVNKFLIKSLSNDHESAIRVFHKETALAILSDYRSKQISAVAKYKGDFELSPFSKLSIVCYRKTVKSQLSGFKKFSKKSHFSNKLDAGEVVNKTGFVDTADPNLKFIDPTELIKGYEYGQQTVRIDKQAEEFMKLNNERCLKLLGFVLENKIPRYFGMSCADCIFANEDQINNLRAFNALVLGMIRTHKVALARFISRKNESPKLVVLYPRMKECPTTGRTVYMLYSLEMPTIEDIREYVFGSSLKSNSAQQRVMSELIDRMDLKNFSDGNLDIEENPEEKNELLKPSETFNPVFQIFNQRLLEKGLSNNVGEFNRNQIDPFILDYVNTQKKTHAKVTHLQKTISETFDLQEKERPEKQQKIFWSKLLEEELKTEAMNQRMEKLKNKDDDPVTRNISSNHPISDFREMINYRREDLVEPAIKQMQAMIVDLVKNSIEFSFFEKASECLAVLREGCVQEEEFELFNDFLWNFKERLLGIRNFSEFWRRFIQNRINLITADECPRSPVTPEDAETFWMDPEDMNGSRIENEADAFMDDLE
jgi:hypothetical protein